MSSAWPHRCDEFPAEYSLASCSPAELASASSAAAMLQQQPSFVEVISANGNQGVLVLSQRRGSPQQRTPRRDFSTTPSVASAPSFSARNDRLRRVSQIY